MADIKLRPNYRNIEGILVPAKFNPDCVREAINYKPKANDVFVVTYPKCGTTWMQHIALQILRKGKELEDTELIGTLSPFIDFMGKKGIENMSRPGVLKTHLPYSHVPYSPETKYIYALRNPKDCCVSYYYHTRQTQPDEYKMAEFDNFFEFFMTGEVGYNDYFDHLMSWYPHINDKNVFFTTYEEMKKDAKDVVLKVAAFLGQDYISTIEKDNNVLNNILLFSGFDYLKTYFAKMHPCHVYKDKKDSTKEEEIVDESPEVIKLDLLRKGIVGDWKNHFSDEQSKRMNKKFAERAQGTDIYDMYKSYMTV